MSATSFPCPACRVILYSKRPVPGGKQLQCPHCESHFTLPVEEPPGAMLSPLGRPAHFSVPLVGGERMPPPPPRQPRGAIQRGGPPPSHEDIAPGPDPVRPPDLHRLYRNFAIAWVGTIVLMSVVFGGALYFLTRGQVKPDSEILQSQGNQAEEEKALQQSAEKAQKELAKRQTDFHQLMIQGGIALGNQRFEEALKDYQEALKLFPDNVDAAKALSECRSALEARNKAQAESDKRRAEFAQVMNQGKEAMKDRQFTSAVRAFDNALRVMPGDVTAARAFRDAQAALEAEQVVKKKEADFDRHMTAGRADMVGQRYAEARDEFLAAL